MIISGRTSHEVRGLKLNSYIIANAMESSRTSHEVRGLKCNNSFKLNTILFVAPHTRCVD